MQNIPSILEAGILVILSEETTEYTEQHGPNKNLTPRREDYKTPRNRGFKLLAPWCLGVFAVRILSACQRICGWVANLREADSSVAESDDVMSCI
jgi:hypothetical protein